MHSFVVAALFALGATAGSIARSPFPPPPPVKGLPKGIVTTSGVVVGGKSSWKPEVSEWLGVPFAQPPVGDLRWSAPRKLHSNKYVNATRYAASCSESTSWRSRANPNAPNNIGASEGPQSEDCLYLNIWSKPSAGKKKAVMIWIYGGGFVVGSANNQAYIGARLAEENDVVVVGVNYRLGVLGFPGVPLETQSKNFGLLDQRIAVEWLRDNIAKFGGDPKRMIMFGQSAGGMSVDAYAYAWEKDPIVHGVVPQSGSLVSFTSAAGSNTSGTGPIKSAAWASFAKGLGCPDAERTPAQFACLRGKSTQQVLEVSYDMFNRNISFTPSADEETIFSDSARRLKEGRFAKIPILVGNVNNEQASSGKRIKPDSPEAKAQSCRSISPAEARIAQDVPVYRYLYAAEFANNGLGETFKDEVGAWHGAELAVLFGTTELKNKGLDTPNEARLGRFIRNAWAEFARDPRSGLEGLGWPMYDPSEPTVAVLGYGGKDSGEVKYESTSVLDVPCPA